MSADRVQNAECKTQSRSIRNRLVAGVVVCVIILAAVAMACQPVRSPDVWHHVASGRLVAENGGAARADVFSHTAQGKRWIQYEWLAQLVIYSAWRVGKIPGLMLLRLAAVAGVAVLLILAVRARNASWPALAIAAALAFCCMSARCFTRPELFTWLFFAGLMFAVEKLRQGRYRLVFIPALLIVPWVNMHGAWVAGLAWFGLTCGGETLALLLKRKSALPRRTLKFLWLGLGLAFLATLANPFGWHIWEVPFALSSSSEVTRHIAEWQRPGLDFWLKPRNVGAWAVALALLLAARGPRISDWLIIVFFGALSLTAVRHLSLAMLATCPILARQLDLLWKTLLLPPLIRRLFARPAMLVATILLLCVVLTATALGGPSLRRAGWGINQTKYPIGAAQFLKEKRLSGNLFNYYDFGNLLLFELFPKNLVFIDGRIDMYGSETARLYLQILLAKPGWQKALEQHEVDICVLKTAGVPTMNLVTALHKSPDWEFVFWDDISAVYVKRTPARKQFLEANYIYTIGPGEVDSELMQTPRGLALAKRDYARKVEEDPACMLALKGLADAEALAGNPDRAVELLRTALEIAPDSADLHYNLGAILLETGRFDKAEVQFKQVVASGKFQGKAWKSLGAIRFHQGRLAEAVGCMKKALRYQPADWQIWWNLSMLYERSGDISRAIDAAERVLALDPKHTQARERIAALQKQQGAQP